MRSWLSIPTETVYSSGSRSGRYPYSTPRMSFLGVGRVTQTNKHKDTLCLLHHPWQSLLRHYILTRRYLIVSSVSHQKFGSQLLSNHLNTQPVHCHPESRHSNHPWFIYSIIIGNMWRCPRSQ